MSVLSSMHDDVRTFRNIVVHPSQEMLRHPIGAFFRGGPAWPHFKLQVYARHCWYRVPMPADTKPRPSDQPVEIADTGIWCGPITAHFGHQVADFGMRIAHSSRLDTRTPLVFSGSADRAGTPLPFHDEIFDHLGIDRSRIILVHKPTRFGHLSVVPQAERRFGGGPSRRHLELMDAITAPSSTIERDIRYVFVSRSRWRGGRFAGESYLDEVLSAAGVVVVHPENLSLRDQFLLYRRARCLIFSEGSALHSLQLLGHIDSDIVVLIRRPGSRLAAASLRPRARSLWYLPAAHGVIYGLLPTGRRQEPTGISVFDETRLVKGVRQTGVDLAPFWDSRIYAQRRDADIAAWIAGRLKRRIQHPKERMMIEKRLTALSLRHLTP